MFLANQRYGASRHHHHAYPSNMGTRSQWLEKHLTVVPKHECFVRYASLVSLYSAQSLSRLLNTPALGTGIKTENEAWSAWRGFGRQE